MKKYDVIVWNNAQPSRAACVWTHHLWSPTSREWGMVEGRERRRGQWNYFTRRKRGWRVWHCVDVLHELLMPDPILIDTRYLTTPRPSHNVRTNFSKQRWCSFGRQSRAHSFKLKIWLFIADFNDKSPYLHEILFPIPNMELYPRDNSVCALNFYTRTLCRWPQASWSWVIDWSKLSSGN